MTLVICAEADMVRQVGVQHNLLQSMGDSTEQQV